MSQFTIENRLFVSKRETEAGTKVDLVSADNDCRVRDFSIADLVPEFDDESSKYLTGDHTRDEAIAGKEVFACSYKIRHTSGVLSGVSPALTGKLPFKKYLESAGLKSVFSSTTGVWTLTPQKTADVQTISSAVIDVDSDGKGVAILGVGGMSEYTFSVDDTGKPFMHSFSSKYKIGDVLDLDSAEIPEYSDDDGIAVVAENNTNTVISIQEIDNFGAPVVGSTPMSLCLKSFELNTGNKLSIVECQADNSGVLHYMITGREPKFKMNPLYQLLADFDYWKMVTQMRRVKIIITKYDRPVSDITKKPLLRVTMPHCQLMKSVPTDSDGYIRSDMELRLLRNIQGATAEEKEQDYKIEIWGITNEGSNQIPA